jgi:chromosome segregation ATPase
MTPELQSALVAFLAAMTPVIAIALSVMNSRQQEATRAQQETVRAQKIINDEFIKERAAREKLETEREIQAAELVRLNGLIVNNAKQINDMKLSLDTVSDERDDLKKKLEATGRELATTKDTLNARISEVVASMAQISSDYEGMQRKYETMTIEREQTERELRERAQQLETENQQHQARIEELTIELVNVRGQLATTEAERDLLNARMQEIESEKLALLEQVNAQTVQIDALRRELDALRVRADTSDIAVDKLNDAQANLDLPNED